MSGTFYALNRLNSKLLLVAAILGLLISSLQSAQAQTLTTVYNFAGYPNDGSHPFGGVVRDAQGNLYGTTEGDGKRDCHRQTFNCGTIYKLTPNGTETILHSFPTGVNARPVSPLLLDGQGTLYGTTQGTGGPRELCGSVFRLKKQRVEKQLYAFRCGWWGQVGAFPTAGVVMDSQGNLFGTTSSSYGNGLGLVYEITAAGGERVLYMFGSHSGDGLGPFGTLIIDAQGNLYGTTYWGGAYYQYGCGGGTVYKLAPDGTETILYNFCSQPNGVDGFNPYFSSLILDAQVSFYGTTSNGGAYGYGTVFKLSADGIETVLHSFSGAPDGASPYAGVVMDAQGNLYGTTTAGGAFTNTGCGGTVFKLSPGGAETILHSFGSGTNCSDGSLPTAGVVLDAQGNLYGTTLNGGAYGYGTVFKLTP